MDLCPTTEASFLPDKWILYPGAFGDLSIIQVLGSLSRGPFKFWLQGMGFRILKGSDALLRIFSGVDFAFYLFILSITRFAGTR